MAQITTNLSFGSCFESKHADPSLEIRVIGGVLLSFFFVVGCISNVKVIHVFRGKATPLRRSTAWILRNLALVDLIACLVNIPCYFVLVIVKPQGNILYFLSNFTMTLTQATSWGNFLCFIFLSMDRSDAIVRLNVQRITFRRLQLLLLLMWFSAAIIGMGFLYFQSSSLCLVLWKHKTVLRINPVEVCVFLLGFSTIIYVSKSCYVIRRSIKQQLVSTTSILPQREKTITSAIMMNVVFFLVTYLPYVITKLGHCLSLCFNIDLSVVDSLVIAKTLMFLGHVMNPFIYARISPTFIRVSSVAFSRVDPVIRGTGAVQNKGETPGHEHQFQLEAIKSEETRHDAPKGHSNSKNECSRPPSSKSLRGDLEELYFISAIPSISELEHVTQHDMSTACQSKEERSDDRSEEMNGQPV